MKTYLDLDELTKQTRRREFDDGLLDFVIGGFFLICGFLGAFFFSYSGMHFYISSLVRHRTLTILVLLGIIPLLFLIIYGSRKLIERIRRATFWSKSGFTKSLPIQVSWPVNLAAVVVYIGVVVLSIWLVNRGQLDSNAALNSLVAAAGLATGVVCVGLGLSLGLYRYLVVGIAGGLPSIFILFLPVSFAMSWLFLGLVWGTVLFASGFWAFRGAVRAFKEVDSE